MDNIGERTTVSTILSNGARRTRWRHELCVSIKRILLCGGIYE
ncbi:protein of unknown function [Tepidibacter aestuarii]|nr:protein of unknown function [Tepidibacter aestuarii]